MTAHHAALAEFGRLSPEQRKALIILLRRRGIDAAAVLPIVRVDRDGPLPVSYGQQRLWFHAQLRPDSSAYHIADAVQLSGPLDRRALQTAVDGLVARHESLRTSFHETEGVPVQRIHERAEGTVAYTDLSALAETTCPSRVRELLDTMATEPFVLQAAPLMRVTLIKLGEDRHVLGFCLHHIVADEWSLNLIVAEFADLYFAARGGRTPRLPTLAVQYADFAGWQRSWLEAGEMERQLDYWRNQLGTEFPVLDLAPGTSRDDAELEHGAAFTFEIPPELRNGVSELCRDAGATPFMVLLAAFQALLFRATGERSIRVGVPHANRSRQEVQDVVGFFVNTLVLQGAVTGSMRFRDLLAQVREAVLGAHAHADLPFDHLVEALQPERSLDRHPLFQVMFNHQRAEGAAVRALESLRMAPYPRDERTTQFDLILDTVERADGTLGATFTYAVARLAAATVERLAGQYVALLDALVSAPAQRLGMVD
ncbi:condensation domain-containing protein, partial [Methylolobus aquaticus]